MTGTTEEATQEEWSAGGVVLRAGEKAIRVLLIRDPYRNWGLPKGHIEGEETAVAAALREVREETGLENLILGPEVGTIDWRFRQGGVTIHKYCRFFLMQSPWGEAVPEVAEGITECRWLPLADAIEGITYENARGILRQVGPMLDEGASREAPWKAWLGSPGR